MRRPSVCLALFLAAQQAYACPAFLPAKRMEEVASGPRGSVRLFAYAPGAKNEAPRWRSLPVQVDPLDAEGLLLTDKSPEKAPVGPHDRLVLRVEDFGSRMPEGAPAPCKTDRVLELQHPRSSSRFAYLASCLDAAAHTATTRPPVRHFGDKRLIESDMFSYEYLPNNQLMYKELVVRHPETGKTAVAAGAADMLLHLDVKNFFTMEFDNSRVESFVNSTYAGDLGLVANISFFLKILFFKINLKMDTSVAYYKDAGLIPMKFEAPVEDMLHPGSGILYNWTRRDAKIEATDAEIPFAKAALIKQGGTALAEQGRKYCKGERCLFRLKGRILELPFSLDMQVPSYLVERGFYPQFVPDLNRFKKEMGWDDDPEHPGDMVAVFFENSQVPKGMHRLEQWIRVGDQGAPSCPDRVVPRRMVGVRQEIAH